MHNRERKKDLESKNRKKKRENFSIKRKSCLTIVFLNWSRLNGEASQEQLGRIKKWCNKTDRFENPKLIPDIGFL